VFSVDKVYSASSDAKVMGLIPTDKCTIALDERFCKMCKLIILMHDCHSGFLTKQIIHTGNHKPLANSQNRQKKNPFSYLKCRMEQGLIFCRQKKINK